mmetsp:Transcript_3251/g.5932  ORF Transcript_3251/g.5932 Transcript_3251/m.5932 type:complete len:317 (-) Transcript_3251:106-1056(-)
MGSSAERELSELVRTVTKAADAAADGDAVERGRALDVLSRLAKFDVSLELLAATQAGKSMKKLSKSCKEKAVAEKAAEVVGVWKRAVSAGGSASNNKGTLSSSGLSSPKPSSAAPEPTRSSGSTLTTGANKAAAGGSGVVPTPKLTGDSTRDKGRKLLAESLHTATTEEQNHDEYLLDVAELAADIEQAMFSQFGGTNKQYMAKFRNLRFNLKDPKNPDLRGRVVRGDVSPADLVTLSSEALASREVQEKNEKIREWAMFEAERGKHNKQASTDQFQCGKCKQRKTRYFQMQTRSADEPMTTFVTCVNCGHRWKFC